MAVVAVVLVVGGISVLYLPAFFNPKKSVVVDIVIPMFDATTNNTRNNGFCPNHITVVIGINNTVRWTNDDPTNIPHTITEGKPVTAPLGNYCTIHVKGLGGPFLCPTTAPLFDSGDVPRNGTFTYTFTNAGVYEYFCIYHPFMIGFVTVKR